jgi:hypothetical protein
VNPAINFLLPVQKKVTKKRTFFLFHRNFASQTKHKNFAAFALRKYLDLEAFCALFLMKKEFFPDFLEISFPIHFPYSCEAGKPLLGQNRRTKLRDSGVAAEPRGVVLRAVFEFSANRVRRKFKKFLPKGVLSFASFSLHE